MILVFGKTGQVARELQCFRDVIALGRERADLSNPALCAQAIGDYKPQMVINAAAYTAVDQAEQEESLATIINGSAPASMAQACVALDIPLVHISTDYVFSGAGHRPWVPDDLTAPQNSYGRSKLLGEHAVRDSGAVHAILRTAWVVSAHGKNFIKTMLQLSKNRSMIRVINDQIGAPTPARDIAMACVVMAQQLKEDPSKSGTYHFTGAPAASWYDFALEIFAQSGQKIDVEPISTKDYFTPAKRPLNSRMNCSATAEIFGITQPDWRDGLNDILKQLKVIT